jgi:PAS domain S-box-containing protein
MVSKKIHKYFLASIVESSQDSIISVDADLRITSWNKAAEDLYGYRLDEALGEQLTKLTRDQDLKMITTKVQQVLELKTVKMFDTERLGKDNHKLHLEVVMSPVKDGAGTVIGVSTIARDVSLRWHAENAARERELLRRVLLAQENERARLSRDLHDQLGQRVTSLRFMLRSLKDRNDEPQLRSEVDEMELVTRDIDHDLDLISWELRPVDLDTNASLTSAINNFTLQWSRHSGIPVKRIARLPDRVRLMSVGDINLYRLIQEAFNNIRKHAEATEVELSLKMQGDSLALIIADNGKGFNTKIKGNGNTGFGLVGMKERSELIGATFEIESEPGKGTTIYVRVPINSK